MDMVMVMQMLMLITMMLMKMSIFCHNDNGGVRPLESICIGLWNGQRAGRLSAVFLYSAFRISVFLQCIAERFPAVNTDLFKSCPFSSPRAVLSLNWRDQTVHFRLESRNMASSMIVSKVCFKMFQAVSKCIPMKKIIIEKQCFRGASAIIKSGRQGSWMNSFLGSVCRHFVAMESLIGR